MRRKNLIITLIFIVVCSLSFTPNVYAGKDKEDAYSGKLVFHPYGFNGKTTMSTGVLARPCGNGGTNCKKGSSEQMITASNSYIRIGDHEYKAWCIDPALHASSGYNYFCSPINSGGALDSLFSNCENAKNNKDLETYCSFAFRFFSVYLDTAMTATDSSGNVVHHAGLTARKAAMIRYLQAEDGGMASQFPNYTGRVKDQFLKADNDNIRQLVEKAQNDANVIRMENMRDDGDEDFATLKFIKGTVTPEFVEYTVKSPVKVDTVRFGIEGAELRVLSPWNGKQAQIRVTTSGSEDCNFSIFAYFDKEGVYSCYAGEGKQLLLIKITNPEDAKLTFKDKNPKCGDPECCEEEIPEMNGQVFNCCESSTHSYVREPDLNDLFCYHKTGGGDESLDVPYYWEKCNADAYLDYEHQINDFCDLYCTERVSIDTPGATSGIAGRYFVLAHNPVGSTTSPYVQGTKRCRMIVYYDKWEEAYIKIVKAQIDNYNNFQKYSAWYDMYVDAEPHQTVMGSGNAKLKCAKQVPKTCDEGVTDCGTEEQYEEKTASFNYNYKKWTYKPYDFPYFTIEMDDNTSSVLHQKFKIGKPTRQIPDRTVTVWDMSTQISNANAVKNGLSCSDGYYEKERSRDNIPDESALNEDHDAKKNQLLASKRSYKDAYQKKVQEANDHEAALDDCDDYFDLTPAEEMYQFEPSIGFRYNQIYRADTGESVLDTIDIPFEDTPGCSLEGPSGQDSQTTYSESGVTGIDTEPKAFSPKYFTYPFMGDDFSVPGIEYELESDGYKKYIEPNPHENRKWFRHDAKYEAKCEWEESSNTINTLVPDGVASAAEEEYRMTIHNKEYRIFLTTYEGKFETEWTMTGVGENGKFDNFIIDGQTTCAGNAATLTEAFTCTLQVKYEIIYVGTCNTPVTINPPDCPPVTAVSPLYEFKVADPKDLFPLGTTSADGKKIAYNWTDREKGREVREIIENKGELDTTYARENASYEYTLSASTMRHIKKYNISKNQGQGGYTDFDLKCNCPPDPGNDATHGRANYTCVKCKSDFLDNLYAGKVRYDGVDHDVDAWDSRLNMEQARTKTFWR